MTMDYNEVTVGFDLGRDFSVFTFYHKNNTEPMTVSSVPGEEKYLFPTPRDLFPLIEQEAELGVALLSNFFKMCFEKLSAVGPLRDGDDGDHEAGLGEGHPSGSGYAGCAGGQGLFAGLSGELLLLRVEPAERAVEA